MLYYLSRGWVNQWNNSITLGNCTIWVLNIRLVKLSPPFVCNQFQPVIFSLLWYSWTMQSTATQSVPFILCTLLLPLLFSLRFKNAGQCMCCIVCQGGWVNQWNNSITSGNCTIWVLNISLAKLSPPFVCNQFQPVIFSLPWYSWTMHSPTTQSVPFILCTVLLPIWFSLRSKNAGQCMCCIICQGGELTSEITP